MAELDKKRRGELLRGVFDVLADNPEGIQAKDALAEVYTRIGATAFEAENYPGSEIRRFERTVRFQTITAVKAGWMVKEAGVWSATPEGLAAFQKITDPEAFLDEAKKLYKAWEEAQPPKEPEEEEAEFPDASVTLEQAIEDSGEAVRAFLGQIAPYDFQHLVAGLLRGMGYHVAWVSPPGKDRGLDIVALGDPVGTHGPRVKVQVKSEKTKVDAKTLRAFMSVLHEGDIGLFVNLGGFTSDAESEARNEARRITLIGENQLFDLWAQYYDRIPGEDHRRLPIRQLPFLDISG